MPAPICTRCATIEARLTRWRTTRGAPRGPETERERDAPGIAARRISRRPPTPTAYCLYDECIEWAGNEAPVRVATPLSIDVPLLFFVRFKFATVWLRFLQPLPINGLTFLVKKKFHHRLHVPLQGLRNHQADIQTNKREKFVFYSLEFWTLIARLVEK